MAYNKLSNYATTIASPNGSDMVITYHRTAIVTVHGDGSITLDSGGWQTATTKRKMNQAANQFNLGFQVYQNDFNWYVDLPNDHATPFVDGMTFTRSGDPVENDDGDPNTPHTLDVHYR